MFELREVVKVPMMQKMCYGGIFLVDNTNGIP